MAKHKREAVNKFKKKLFHLGCSSQGVSKTKLIKSKFATVFRHPDLSPLCFVNLPSGGRGFRSWIFGSHMKLFAWLPGCDLLILFCLHCLHFAVFLTQTMKSLAFLLQCQNLGQFELNYAHVNQSKYRTRLLNTHAGALLC